MKGLKCTKYLVLFITLLAGLGICSNVSALRHTYLGFPLFGIYLPGTNNDGEPDWNQSSQGGGQYENTFKVSCEGDCTYSDDNNFASFEFDLKGSMSYLDTVYSDNRCKTFGTPAIGDPSGVNAILSWTDDWENNHFTIASRSPYIYPVEWTGISHEYECSHRKQAFGVNGIPEFEDRIGYTYQLTCSKENGAKCPGLWSFAEYYASQMRPFWYTTNAIILQSKAIDADGIRYSNSFSFSDLFNIPFLPRFSYLSIPLYSYDNYWYDSEGLYRGRAVEFRGAFEFDGNITFNPDLDSNGSSFKVHILYDSLDPDNSDYELDVPCSVTLYQLGVNDFTRLEYSCPFNLPYNMLDMFPTLVIDGNDDYFFETDDDWYFSYTYLITDNDETPGDPFCSDCGGPGWVPGDAENDIEDNEPDFFATLSDLFTFGFFNPFAPLFDMFSDNNSCASIPTLASMLHSDETQVCPWFNSTTRNIVTPVLGLSSMMLVFGFAVKWLGSSSGNLFEDSHSTENYEFKSKYRRKR